VFGNAVVEQAIKLLSKLQDNSAIAILEGF
jgi:hypothetical protein